MVMASYIMERLAHSMGGYHQTMCRRQNAMVIASHRVGRRVYEIGGYHQGVSRRDHRVRRGGVPSGHPGCGKVRRGDFSSALRGSCRGGVGDDR